MEEQTALANTLDQNEKNKQDVYKRQTLPRIPSMISLQTMS